MRVAFAAAVALFAASPAFASKTDSEALLSKSRAAELAGNREAALRYAQAAIVADPARPETYTALADLYMHERSPDSAAFYYSEALTIDPQDQSAAQGLALAEKESGTAAAAASDALDKNPDR